MTILEALLSLFFTIIGLVIIYTFFIWIPVALYAESECLASGYPKAYVTVGLERYCSNLDGAVTVKVEKVKK